MTYSVDMSHVPVFLETTLEVLSPKSGERVLDVTLGLGGHAREFLRAIGSSGFLVGLDADKENLEVAQKNLQSSENTLFLQTNFSELPEVLPDEHRQFDVILADLGLSSPHIDNPERGFTFRTDSPLDMRFDQSVGESAARVLQASDPITLRKIFREYGELSRVPDLVEAIVARRSSEDRVRTSGDLKGVVEKVYGFKASKVLPQVFQSLRIHVNDELGSLKKLLVEARSLLAIGGRFGVISYHSLEDRIVKESFRSITTPTKDPFTGASVHEPDFTLILRKPLKPDSSEILRNPRARSAVFRAIQRRS